MNDFAVFILTYGRANNVVTYETLRRFGYTGKIYLLCSTDDKTLPEYQKKYGKEVIVFDKEKVKGTFDIGDNFDKMNVVVFARNAIWDIAKSMKIKYFLELDDDYSGFEYKIPTEKKLEWKNSENLDAVFGFFVEYLKNTKNIYSLCFGQGGDYIGGRENDIFYSILRKRKAMNCFFNATDRPYKFYGRINEDVNCYIQNGKTGFLFLTHPSISARQKTTQTNSGGLTEFYLETGTYIKSFYTVLFNPSCVKVKMMGESHRRLHHSISWKNAVPCIIREEYKKPSQNHPEKKKQSKAVK